MVDVAHTATRAELGRGRVLAWTITVIPVTATVATYGELTVQAFVAVLLAGGALMAAALRRRAGSGSPAVPGGRVWLVWLVALGVWEFYTLLHEARLPTLSDLMDPVLARPVVRGAATVVWFAAGIWLLRRPSTAGTGGTAGTAEEPP
jgi:hypothetical protein